MATNRNAGIELFRFVFMMIICLGHYARGPLHLFHFYIGVEFFFIVSGFFLYETAISGKVGTPIDFLLNKLKRLLPEYLLVLALSVIVDIIYYNLKGLPVNWAEYALSVFSSSFLIQNIGCFAEQQIVVVFWFVSVLVIAGIVLYTLLWLNRKLSIGLIIPIITVLFYTVVFSQYQTIDFSKNQVVGCFHLPLWRGIADMGIGCLISSVVTEHQEEMKKRKVILDVLSVISILALFSLIFYEPNYDQYCILFMIIIVFALTCDGSMLNRLFNARVFEKAGSITYEMYLLQILVATMVKSVFHIDNLGCMVIIYLIFLFVGAIALKRISLFVRSKVVNGQ